MCLIINLFKLFGLWVDFSHFPLRPWALSSQVSYPNLYFDLRIWQCSDGHPVCEHCRKKPEVTCCPTCRKYIVGRSTIAEKMARSLFGGEMEEVPKITLTGFREVKIERG